MGKSAKIVAVTGGAGQIAYSLLFRIASGEMLGSDQPIILHMLEMPQALAVLQGVVMELWDCACPLLKQIKVCTRAEEAFEGAHIALLIGAKPRGLGMERKQLLLENAPIFVQQGKSLNVSADKNCFVLVVGNPCNTNALLVRHHAPSLNPKRIFSMMRLDESRAKAQLAMKANVGVDQVRRMQVWGNHSATQVPDFTHATIGGDPAAEKIPDRLWLEKAFVETVQKRGAAVIAARGKSSAASAACAAIEAVRALMHPTAKGDFFPCGIASEGNPYGLTGGLQFSFPCVSKGDADIEIVPDLTWNPLIAERIQETQAELLQERATIEHLL